jgi:predicted dinucleotide-binding enzyme
MKVGVIGSGNMGRTLGLVMAERGHEVFFGSRRRERGRDVAALAPRGAQHGTNDEAAAFGNVILWTVRAPPEDVLTHLAALDGKVVLDVNNTPVPEGYRLGRSGPSVAEELAAALPRARIVKAFNTAAQEIYEHPPALLNQVSGFLAGDDAEAKAVAADVVRAVGLDPVDVGPLAAARMLEGAADLIRNVMTRLGVYATISIHVLPPATTTRFGGRRASRLK